MTGHERCEGMTVGERFAIVFCQHRLRIEGINLREPTIEKNMDDAFSAGPRVQWRICSAGKQAIPSEQAGQGNHAKSHTTPR